MFVTVDVLTELPSPSPKRAANELSGFFFLICSWLSFDQLESAE